VCVNADGKPSALTVQGCCSEVSSMTSPFGWNQLFLLYISTGSSYVFSDGAIRVNLDGHGELADFADRESA
jgi:hypothetical protein